MAASNSPVANAVQMHLAQQAAASGTATQGQWNILHPGESAQQNITSYGRLAHPAPRTLPGAPPTGSPLASPAPPPPGAPPATPPSGPPAPPHSTSPGVGGPGPGPPAPPTGSPAPPAVQPPPPEVLPNGMTLLQWDQKHPGMSAGQNKASFDRMMAAAQRSAAAAKQAATDKAATDKATQDQLDANNSAQNKANIGLDSVTGGAYWTLDPASAAAVGQQRQALQGQVGSMGTTYDPVTGLTKPAVAPDMGPVNFETMTKTMPDGRQVLVDKNGNVVDTQDRGSLGTGWGQSMLGLEGQYQQDKAQHSTNVQNLTNTTGGKGTLFSGMNALSNQQELADYTNKNAALTGQATTDTSGYGTAQDTAVSGYNQGMNDTYWNAAKNAMAARTANPNQYLGDSGQIAANSEQADALKKAADDKLAAAKANAAKPVAKPISLVAWDKKHPKESAAQNAASYYKMFPKAKK